MADNDGDTGLIKSQRHPAVLLFAVVRVKPRHGMGVSKYGGGAFKGKAVFTGVPCRFVRVPLKLVFKAMFHYTRPSKIAFEV
jgi:hypothetical protein